MGSLLLGGVSAGDEVVGTETRRAMEEAGERPALPIPLLPAACKAKGDTKELPKTFWETACTSWLFCALVGASFQGIPWDFTCLPDPLLPVGPGKHGQCRCAVLHHQARQISVKRQK